MKTRIDLNKSQSMRNVSDLFTLNACQCLWACSNSSKLYHKDNRSTLSQQNKKNRTFQILKCVIWTCPYLDIQQLSYCQTYTHMYCIEFLFCLFMLATMCWASVTALVCSCGRNNVATVLRRAKTVRQKQRRTWRLHMHVHWHVTLVKETIRSI
jgi:hypothetical protein